MVEDNRIDPRIEAVAKYLAKKYYVANEATMKADWVAEHWTSWCDEAKVLVRTVLDIDDGPGESGP